MLTDYYDRIAFKNGFYDLKSFKRHLKKSIPEIPYNYETHRHNAAFMERVAVMLGVKLHHMDIDSIPPTSALAKGKLKVCKSCFYEKSIVLFYWYFGEYQYCHLHDEKLIKVKDKRALYNSPGKKIIRPIFEGAKGSGYFESCVKKNIDDENPQIAIANDLQNRIELNWLIESIERFFTYCFGQPLNSQSAYDALESREFNDISISERCEMVMDLLVIGSKIPATKARLIAALLMWQRQRSDLPGLIGISNPHPNEPTFSGLQWASLELYRNEYFRNMMFEVIQAGGYPRIGQRFKHFIPGFGDISDKDDMSIYLIVCAIDPFSKEYLPVDERKKETAVTGVGESV